MQLKKFARRVNRIDTRQIREHGLEILTKLAEEAYANAQNKEFDSRERQNWSRLAAYIYQTVNSLAQDYDAVKVAAKVEELKKLVKAWTAGKRDKTDRKADRGKDRSRKTQAS
jgi:hypothetical protein